MMFVEVFVPRGALDREELERLARRLTTHGLYGTEGTDGTDGTGSADPGVMDFLETLTDVVVHEVDVWVSSGRVLGADGQPRYVVRAHVPGPWRAEVSGPLVTRVTAALAAFDREAGRPAEQPNAAVHVLGLPEGGYGTLGRVVGQADLMDMINAARTARPGGVPDGTAVDPVCGATVPLDGPEAVTAEVHGTIHGFCCAGCRRHFLAGRERTA